MILNGRPTASGSCSSVFSPLTEIGSIYVMDSDGSNLRFVTDGLVPKWSPDGTKIAFHTHPVIYGQPDGGLWVIGADGTGKHLVAKDAGDPAWARDGRHIIAGMRINGAVNVYSISLDGSQRRKLTNESAYACEPDVSPDGSLVAYVASLPTRLHVMDIDGAGSHPVSAGEEWDLGPSWSPDGTFIAFQRDEDADLHYVGALAGAGGTAPSRIVIARSDGSGEVELPAGDHSDADPAFAPRGS